ncbi:TRAP transporter small permease [Hydrogenophaga sp. OTU3427]|uniref:TRAP transporter small permease n=1 Tax=Hydrogenophaga sp. OTU3427 TaxID=3043856 RepID=UPI00313C14A1
MSEGSPQAGPLVPAGPLRPLLVPLCRVFEWAAMVLVVVTTSAIMVEVFARGLFNLGLPGAGEIAKYAGLGLIFLTVPLLLAQDAHVKVDMLFTRSRGLPRRVLAVFNELATFAFCVLFLVSCWWFMQRAARFSTPALSIPNLWYYMPAIAGMVLTTLVALDRVIGILRGKEARAGEARPC